MRIGRALRAVALAVACAAASAGALAHKSSDSYLHLDVDGSSVLGQWDIALRDLDMVLALDADQDGFISWAEVRRRQRDVAAYALARLSIRTDGVECPLAPEDQLIDRHSDGAYVVLRFQARCPRMPARLSVDYRLLFDVDPQHRGLLQLTSTHGTRTAIFAPDQARQDIALGSPAGAGQFLAYVRHGITHIWLGFDHILFLLSLLIPAVLRREGNRWHAAESFKSSFLDVVSVVSAFTVAHSITLSAAALGFVSLPSRLVESAIAASVVLAAANNVYPIVSERRWLLAFCFGLVHGFGFASVLSDLGLPRESLLVSLVSFNLGVELGQLAIVAAFLPLAWLVRRRRIYSPVTVYAGSAAIAALAATWLLERAFDMRLL